MGTATCYHYPKHFLFRLSFMIDAIVADGVENIHNGQIRPTSGMSSFAKPRG